MGKSDEESAEDLENTSSGSSIWNVVTISPYENEEDELRWTIAASIRISEVRIVMKIGRIHLRSSKAKKVERKVAFFIMNFTYCLGATSNKS